MDGPYTVFLTQLGSWASSPLLLMDWEGIVEVRRPWGSWLSALQGLSHLQAARDLFLPLSPHSSMTPADVQGQAVPGRLHHEITILTQHTGSGEDRPLGFRAGERQLAE